MRFARHKPQNQNRNFYIVMLWVWVFCFVTGWPQTTAAQDRPTDYQIKAAFLEKFGKFVTWPDDAFATPNAPLVIGIFGQDPFHGTLEQLAENDTINGHRIVVEQIRALPDLKRCHIVFIPAALKTQERDILQAVHRNAVLTVSDAGDFCDAGGMIQFIIEDDQVHFEIKNDAARDAGLKISSKLLMLAKQAGE